jgi:phosphotransferase system enzyme I (PtsI)
MAERTFQGIGVSPGVARGNIYVYSIADEVVPEYDIAPADVQKEIGRFEPALIKTREQLHELQGRITTGMGSGAYSTIPDDHPSITDDPHLIQHVRQLPNHDPQHLTLVFPDHLYKYITTLAELSDEFFRERSADVHDVTRRILRNLLGHDHRALSDLTPNTIFIVHDISTPDTTSIDRLHAAFLATVLTSQISQQR